MTQLFDTPLSPPRLQRNGGELAEIQRIAASGHDYPILMLNLNRYSPGSGFPDSGAYREYIDALGPFLEHVGGKILWRFPVLGQAVGDQRIDEVIAAWYPRHKGFLDLYEAPGAPENYARKTACVEYAVIHRCRGDVAPFGP